MRALFIEAANKKKNSLVEPCSVLDLQQKFGFVLRALQSKWLSKPVWIFKALCCPVMLELQFVKEEILGEEILRLFIDRHPPSLTVNLLMVR